MSENIVILVVEDDPLIGEDLCLTLSNYGYKVLGPITSGEQALEEIEKHPISFIFMDIRLEGELDGIATAERAQGIRPIPVVFLSAIHDEETLRRANLISPFGFLMKPFEGPELRSIIEVTLHRFTQEGVESESHSLAHPIVPYSEKGTGSDQVLYYLSQFPIFRGISRDALLFLGEEASTREVESGKFFLREGEEPSGVFILYAGRVSVTKTSESGKELIVALLAPGDPFGLTYALPALSRNTSARSQIASKGIWITMSSWLQFCEKNPLMYSRLANVLAERLAASHNLSSNLAHSSVEHRIITTLIFLAADFGKVSSEHMNQTRIYITRKELAELTGTTPETAIRETKSMERQGLLDLTRPGIIKVLDMNRLHSLIQ